MILKLVPNIYLSYPLSSIVTRHRNRNRNTYEVGKIGKTNRVMLDVVTFLAHTAHFISFVAYPPNAFEVKIKDYRGGRDLFFFKRLLLLWLVFRLI